MEEKKLKLRRYDRQQIARRQLGVVRAELPRMSATLEGLGWASETPESSRERKLQSRRLLALLQKERDLIKAAGFPCYWKNKAPKNPPTRKKT